MSDGNVKKDDVYSKAVRAGKRTYFFDVKSTRGNDLYLTITESKKKFQDDGRFTFEKHKLFLYKEDFEKFSNGLLEAIDKIKAIKSGEVDQDNSKTRNFKDLGDQAPNAVDFDFDDL